MLTPAAPTSANSRPSSPGRSGSTTGTSAYVVERPPCLPGQPGPAGVAAEQDLAQRVAGPLGVLVDLAQGVHDRVDVLAQLGEDPGHRLGVGGQDVDPQVGVGRRRPG